MTVMINGIFPGKLASDASIAGCIEIYENAWPSPAETIVRIENECTKHDSDIHWQRAETTGDGVYQHTRTNKHMSISQFAKIYDNGLMQNIHNQFNLLLHATTIPYMEKFGIQESIWHEDYCALKYSAGTEYKSHYDSGTAMGRIISSIVYLNNDYEGGELEFPNFGIKIKPKAGMMILFPSNFSYRHVAHPVTTGIKYALVTWIKDRQI
jgi:hypothetical protein